MNLGLELRGLRVQLLHEAGSVCRAQLRLATSIFRFATQTSVRVDPVQLSAHAAREHDAESGQQECDANSNDYYKGMRCHVAMWAIGALGRKETGEVV
jgi:hypothetical protein